MGPIGPGPLGPTHEWAQWARAPGRPTSRPTPRQKARPTSRPALRPSKVHNRTQIYQNRIRWRISAGGRRLQQRQERRSGLIFSHNHLMKLILVKRPEKPLHWHFWHLSKLPINVLGKSASDLLDILETHLISFIGTSPTKRPHKAISSKENPACYSTVCSI